MISLVTSSMLLILMVVFVTEYYVDRQNLVERALEENYANARKLSVLTNDIFLSMEDTLTAREQDIIDNWEDPEKLTNVLNSIQLSNANFNSVSLIDAEGVGRATYPDLGIIGKYVDSEGVRTGIKIKRDFISEPYMGANGKLMLIVSVAIYEEDTYLGMLSGLVWLREYNFLTRLLEETYGTDTVRVSVFDTSGKYIFHRNDEWIGTEVQENQATRDLSNNISGAGEIKDRTDTYFYAGYTNVPINNWSIISMTPKRDVLEPVEKSSIQAFLAVLPVFIGSMVLLVLLILFVTRPLNRIANIDYQQPLAEILEDTRQIKSPYEEVENVKEMIISFAESQQDLIERLELLAITDPLTGLSNRRHFNSMKRFIEENQEAFGYLIFDIDHFKKVNDTYGHVLGDQVLVRLAHIMRETMPETSLSARLGGEEFGVILQDTTPEETYETAEVLRKTIENENFPKVGRITVSVGAGYLDCKDYNTEKFLEEVDQQLYKAKEGGRNRTESLVIVRGQKTIS